MSFGFLAEIFDFGWIGINNFMTTLSDQLQNEFTSRINKFRDEHEAWAMTHEHHITHAVTLTFDIHRLWRALHKSEISKSLHHPEVLELLHGSMRYFKWKLDKSLYGNRRGRLFFVPILEGLNNGHKPHYHCLLGVSADRFDVVETQVKANWSDAPFGGQQVVVKPYWDHGWVGYTTKNALFANRENIDWMNVLLPTCSPLTAE
jgi:hypothetical protein